MDENEKCIIMEQHTRALNLHANTMRKTLEWSFDVRDTLCLLLDLIRDAQRTVDGVSSGNILATRSERLAEANGNLKSGLKILGTLLRVKDGAQ